MKDCVGSFFYPRNDKKCMCIYRVKAAQRERENGKEMELYAPTKKKLSANGFHVYPDQNFLTK